MDCTEISWLSEMGLDNSLFTDQCDFLDSFDDEIAAVLGHDFDTSNNSLYNSSPSSTLINTPSANSINSLYTDQISPPRQNVAGPHEPSPKLQKPNNFSNFSSIQTAQNPNSAPIILNFGNAAENNSSNNINHHHHDQPATNNPSRRALSPDEEAAISEVLRSPHEEQANKQTVKKPSRIRPPSQTYDHIIAERKRREQLSQRFVALSTIVPGLKKMDKTSVLGDAIKYLKHLQERVKTLEEQATKQTMESVVLVKRSQIMVEDEGSSDEKSAGCTSDEQPLPEIEARVCNSHILLRVHCERHKGVLVNLLSKVEKLNLTVINTNVTPFGNLALDITIVAEMEKEFDLTVKEIVKRLRAALKQLSP